MIIIIRKIANKIEVKQNMHNPTTASLEIKSSNKLKALVSRNNRTINKTIE